MRIAIGCDQNGLKLKQTIIESITGAGHSYEDFGCNTTEPVDYPDIARKVARAVISGDFAIVLMICRTNDMGFSPAMERFVISRLQLLCFIHQS